MLSVSIASAKCKIGTDNFVKIDTLKGKIGNSDLTSAMLCIPARIRAPEKKNYLQFASVFLDVAAHQLSPDGTEDRPCPVQRAPACIDAGSCDKRLPICRRELNPLHRPCDNE